MVATHALGACAERRVGSSPTRGTIYAKVEKLVYSLDSKSCAARHAGSSPAFRTIIFDSNSKALYNSNMRGCGEIWYMQGA